MLPKYVYKEKALNFVQKNVFLRDESCIVFIDIFRYYLVFVTNIPT